MSTDLGLMAGAVGGAVAAAMTELGELATVTLPAEEALTCRVFVAIDEAPNGGVQRRLARIAVPIADCPSQPVDGTTIVTDAETWTVRTAVEGVSVWKCEAWA